MPELNIASIKEDLISRRDRLQNIRVSQNDISNVTDLLQQIDSAIERIENGTYGFCEVCHDPIEEDRLLIDPIVCVCLDHLSSKQKKELEEDLELAANIQRNFLPQNAKMNINPWEVFYYYKPAGMVSGDYCDVITSKNDHGLLHFVLGDVSGKGIAASMLMAQMHAMFHSLVDLNYQTNDLVENINRLFCESTSLDHYATLIYGRASNNGSIEICNAGHWSPVIVRSEKTEMVDGNGVPIGLFCESQYSVTKLVLNPDDYMVLYTDGLIEARNGETEYGIDRLKYLLAELGDSSSEDIVKCIIRDINRFIPGTLKDDDMTIMVIKRVE